MVIAEHFRETKEKLKSINKKHIGQRLVKE